MQKLTRWKAGFLLQRMGADDIIDIQVKFFTMREIYDMNNRLQNPADIDFMKVCENLHDGIHVSDGEGRILYVNKGYTRTTGIEGKDIIGRTVAEIEKAHEERYRKLLKNIEDEVVFSRDGDTIWQCRNCGHIVIGKKAPKVCPVCNHPQSYFEIKATNY